MSQRQQSPHRGRPRPPFKASPTKKSASGPGDRIASSRDVAIYLREDCRTLGDSLQLEMVVAQYLLGIAEARSPQGVPVSDAVGAGVVANLEREGDALSHAILRGLAHLGSGDVAARATAAASRLADAIAGLPRQFADVGKAVATGAWRAGGDIEGECVLFAEFEHPSGRRHTIAMYVEPDLGTIKHIGLVAPMDEFSPGGPFDPARLEALEIAAAGELLRGLLERTYGSPVTDTDDFRVLIAAARAAGIPPPPCDQAV